MKIHVCSLGGHNFASQQFVERKHEHVELHSGFDSLF